MLPWVFEKQILSVTYNILIEVDFLKIQVCETRITIPSSQVVSNYAEKDTCIAISFETITDELNAKSLKI